MELAEQFCDSRDGSAKLFYLWGHSYEFDQNDNWQVLEDFFQYISNDTESIWMASNIEILEYVKAFRALKRSTDGRILYNPTGMDIWFEFERQVYCIHGNEKMSFS